jgi:hypothetical protein
LRTRNGKCSTGEERNLLKITVHEDAVRVWPSVQRVHFPLVASSCMNDASSSFLTTIGCDMHKI